MKKTVALSALFLATLMASGCALALPGYNDPFSEKVLVIAPVDDLGYHQVRLR